MATTTFIAYGFAQMSPYKIQQLKASGILKIDNINYMNVCAEMMYASSAIKKLKVIIYSLFFVNLIEIRNIGAELAIVYSLSSKRRPDYEEIIANLSSCVDKSKAIIETNLKFSFIMPLRTVFAVRRVPVLKLMSKLGFVDGMLLTLLSSNYLAHRKYIDRELGRAGCRILFTFCDALPIENLFAQAAKSSGIVTLTLQHGQYAFNDLVNSECSNDESYLNFVSHYICVWGKATYDEFLRAGVESKRVLILGSLRSYSVFGVKTISYADKVTTGLFGLLLSADIYRDDNIRMISLANAISRKYGYTYIVRSHPNNNMDLYKNYLKNTGYNLVQNISLHDYFDKVEFSLMFMTGVFNEAIACRARILIFGSENLLGLYNRLDVTVSDIDDFDKKYKLIISKSSSSKMYDALHEYFNVNSSVCRKYNTLVNNILSDDHKNMH